MQTGYGNLPSPLDAVAGAGLADALRDVLAPAERAPGTPPEHKHWAHLARYLRQDCAFGSDPRRWVALLCSRKFRADWFAEAAPHSPTMRVPIFFRMLWQAQAKGAGETTLAEMASGVKSSEWRFPNATGTWPDDGGPDFERCWHKPTPPADPSLAYERWFEEFGLAMWHAMDALRNKDAEAQLLAASLAERSVMFTPEELYEIGPDDRGIEGSLRSAVARWLREGGIAPANASSEAHKIVGGILPRYGGAADLAAAWLDRAPSGRAYVARFAADGFEKAAGLAGHGDVASSVTMALVDELDIAVPRLKALIAALAYRETRVLSWLSRFIEEAGKARIALVVERGGELAEPLRRAHGSTKDRDKMGATSRIR